MTRKVTLGAVIAAGLLAGSAFAQTGAEEIRITEKPASEIPISVSLEGGLSGYTGSLATNTKTGGLWGVRISADQSFLGAELAYQGSSNGIDDSRVPADQAIFRHEIEGLAKVALPLGYGLRPFLGAGLGVSYVNVSNGAEPIYRNDFMTQIPLGGGVDWNRGRLHAGARMTWSFLLFDEFAEPTPSANNPAGGFLTGSLILGGNF